MSWAGRWRCLMTVGAAMTLRVRCPGLRESWQAMSPDWDQVRVLWLGIETDDSSSYLDAAGYAHLDGIGFPRREVWHGCSLRSGDLTAFAGYARDQGCYEAYDYGAPLAWTGLVVRLLRPAPAEVPILAGFGDGDWLTFH
jgi:hypothetical protein